MNTESPFRISQGYDVIQPRSGKAYPILCSEWKYLKNIVSQVKDEALKFHTMGTLCLGASLSTLISIITGSYSPAKPDDAPTRLIIAWASFCVLVLVGISAIFFSRKQREVTGIKAKNVVEQMELIESRYQDSPEV
jgi:hypothetical protein